MNLNSDHQKTAPREELSSNEGSEDEDIPAPHYMMDDLKSWCSDENLYEHQPLKWLSRPELLEIPRCKKSVTVNWELQRTLAEECELVEPLLLHEQNLSKKVDAEINFIPEYVWDESQAWHFDYDLRQGMRLVITHEFDPSDHELKTLTLARDVALYKYTVTDLLRAQQTDVMILMLLQLLKANGNLPHFALKCTPVVNRLIRAFYWQNRNGLQVTSQGVLVRSKRPEELSSPRQQCRIIILPQLFHQETMRLCHDHNGHLGQRKVSRTIMERFDWPGLQKAVEKYINTCPKCQALKHPSFSFQRHLTAVVSGSPNELLQIDHLKLPSDGSSGSPLGVLVMIDHFTKYAVATPYYHATALETCKILMENWICRFGVPLVVQSDRGPQFTAELTREFLTQVGAAQIHSTAYHPQSNGLVERQNRTLIGLLRAFVGRFQESWSSYLPQALAAYNCMQHETTGYTPNMLMTGHEARLPLSMLFPETSQRKRNITPADHVRLMMENSRKINSLARFNAQARQKIQKKNFDKNTAVQKAYQVGDYVMVRLKVLPRGGKAKLAVKYVGPQLIARVHREGVAYTLNTGQVVSYDRLKPYNPRMPEMALEKDELILKQPVWAEYRSTDSIHPPSKISEDQETESQRSAPHSYEKVEAPEGQHPMIRRVKEPVNYRDQLQVISPAADPCNHTTDERWLLDKLLSVVENLNAEFTSPVISSGSSDVEESVRPWPPLSDQEDSGDEDSLEKLSLNDILQDSAINVRKLAKTLKMRDGALSGKEDWMHEFEYLCATSNSGTRREPKPRTVIATISRKTEFDLPCYFKEVIYLKRDFLNCAPNAKVICITANCSMKRGLAAEFERHLKQKDFLFKQRRGVGEVAILPKGTRYDVYNPMFFLVVALKENQEEAPTRVEMTQCLESLKCELRRRHIKHIDIPYVDQNRRMSWWRFYALLYQVFRNSQVKIEVYTRYKLTLTGFEAT